MGLLLECSIRAALIAAAVAAVIGGLRIANAPARHWAWCGVLAAMLLLPAFSVWGPKATVRVLPLPAGAEGPGIESWIAVASQNTVPPGPPEGPESSVRRVSFRRRHSANPASIGYRAGRFFIEARLARTGICQQPRLRLSANRGLAPAGGCSPLVMERVAAG